MKERKTTGKLWWGIVSTNASNGTRLKDLPKELKKKSNLFVVFILKS